MIVAVMRTRTLPGARPDCAAMERRMGRLAAGIPGYLSHKSFVADDGERALLAEFATEEALRRWAADPAHVEATAAGARLFAARRVPVCTPATDAQPDYLDYVRVSRALRRVAWAQGLGALARRTARHWERFWRERADAAPALRPGGARDHAFPEDLRPPP